nr:hypothetical protein [uncultured Dyadobacter sp.]
MSRTENNILVIGGPHVGKTHFGGQLYGRLIDRQGLYRIVTPPENLSVFQEVLDCLNEGRSAGHTHSSANEKLELEIQDNQGRKILFAFPDYGGEQIKRIVNDRKVDNLWKENIEGSSAWMLFIRLDEILPVEDVINRGLPENDVLEKRMNGTEPMELSDAAFYVELLQILLYTKGVARFQKTPAPQITVVLSCWDKIADRAVTDLPVNLLKGRLPMLYDFIFSNWKKEAISIIGLSSTERTLSNEHADREYVNEGPENFGYIITGQGVKEKDLTKAISTLIGTA